MRQSEFKKKDNPERGKYIKQHIYGEGIIDSVKSFFKPTKKTSKPLPKPPKKVRFDLPSSSAANKKSGDEIVKLLARESTSPTGRPPSTKPSSKKMTQKEINHRVLQIMSGGKITQLICKNYIIIKIK